jgi:hypothetical protein
MKHLMQVLIFAAVSGAGAAHAHEEAHEATMSGTNAIANTLTALNFPKITYGFGAGAARAEQQGDEAAKRGIDLNANTRMAFNFPKITFVVTA